MNKTKRLTEHTTKILSLWLVIMLLAVMLPIAAVVIPTPETTYADTTTQIVFTSNTSWTPPAGVTSVQVLVVAGGGGGGSSLGYTFACGGGGGAGGLIYKDSYTVTPGANYTVVVGAGGAGSTASGTPGTNGSNSSFGNASYGYINASGGGGGGYRAGNGLNGGSGGGSGVRTSDNASSVGTGIVGQGKNGAFGYQDGTGHDNAGGGGGGNGSVGGGGGLETGGNGGSGGDYSAIFGTGVGASGVFAGGGGGGAHYPSTGGSGGSGGGGAGAGANQASSGVAGSNAINNTGGGGGGGASGSGSSSGGNGGNGGSGIVIIQYPTPPQEVYNSSTIWTVPTGVTAVQVLVVAGGGGGGSSGISGYSGAGGGAGGLVYNASYNVTPGAQIMVTVGGGGAGATTSQAHGANGSDSVFGTLTATKGGGGGSAITADVYAGYSGGSGGGGGASASKQVSGGSGTTGQGKAGGNGNYSSVKTAGGGGGGNGSVGGNGSAGTGGTGGTGGNYSATFGTGVGASGWFAGGGGGGAQTTAGGLGGTGGGGNGNISGAGSNATANTGGGGGGGGGGSGAGGNGGSGIVIIKCTTHTLTYAAGSHGSISGTSPQTVAHGASGTAVTANPDACYHFVNWSDSSTQNSRTDTNVQADISVTANFAINTYTLTYTAGPGGTILGNTSTMKIRTSSSDGEIQGNGGAYSTVWSASSSSYVYTGYSQNPLGQQGTYNIWRDYLFFNTAMLPSGASISSAKLCLWGYSSAIDAGCNFSFIIQSGMPTYPHDGLVAGDYYKDDYSGSGGNDYNTSSFVTNWNNISLNAQGISWINTSGWTKFCVRSSRDVAGITSGGNEYVYIDGNESGTTYAPYLEVTYTPPMTQTVNCGANGSPATAVPDPDYYFLNWSDGSSANPRTDTNVSADISVTANFGVGQKILIISAGTGGTVPTPGIGTFVYPTGTLVNLSATPGECYSFDSWSGDIGTIANPISKSTTITINDNCSINANFALNTTILTVSANNSSRGLPYFTGSNPLECGTIVDIVANTSPGYFFNRWSPADGVTDASKANTSVLLTQNRNIIAYYDTTAGPTPTPTPTPVPGSVNTTTTYLTWYVTNSSFRLYSQKPNYIVANITAGINSSMCEYMEKQLTIYIKQRAEQGGLGRGGVWGESAIVGLDSLTIPSTGQDNMLNGDIYAGVVSVKGAGNRVTGTLYNCSRSTTGDGVDFRVGANGPCPDINMMTYLGYIGTPADYLAGNNMSVGILDYINNVYIFTGSSTELKGINGVWENNNPNTHHLRDGYYYSAGTITLTDHSTTGKVTFIANQIIIKNDETGADLNGAIQIEPYNPNDLLLWATGSGLDRISIRDTKSEGGNQADWNACVDIQGILFAPYGEISLEGMGSYYTQFAKPFITKGAIIGKSLTISGSSWYIYRW